MALIGGALLAGKLLQEYVLHYGQWFESFTAFEAVEASLRKLFGKRSETVVQENLRAARRGYDEVMEVPIRG